MCVCVLPWVRAWQRRPTDRGKVSEEKDQEGQRENK